MKIATPKPWLHAVILFGVVYALVGILFALPSAHVQAWRLAAWIVSAAAYVFHIAYERVRLSSSSRSTAVHTALAVALGAFALASAAIVHSLSVKSGNLNLLLIALVVWPVMAAVPAFVVALVAGKLLDRRIQSTETMNSQS